jgi:hypothetical protein
MIQAQMQRQAETQKFWKTELKQLKKKTSASLQHVSRNLLLTLKMHSCVLKMVRMAFAR